MTAPALTAPEILDMPRLYVPTDHEMRLAIETWELRRKDAMTHASAAWDMHDDAIERRLHHDNIEHLAIAAEKMEAEAMDAWHKLNAAKAALLGRMN